MSAVLIELEGTLARDDQKAPGEMTPIVVGLQLLSAMRSRFTLAISTAATDPDAVWLWLLTNGVPKTAVAYLFTADASEPSGRTERFLRHLERARAVLDVGLAVTSSPPAAAKAMEAGVTALVFASPVYQRPEFRPDLERPVRPWDTIEKEITRQRLLKTKDERIVEGVA